MTGSPESPDMPPTMPVELWFKLVLPQAEAGEIAAAQARIGEAAEDVGGTIVAQSVIVPESGKNFLRETLDTFFTHFRFFESVHTSGASSSLWSQGLRTLRDLLVLGADRLRQFDKIGEKSIWALKQKVADLPIPYEFEDKPSMPTVANMCDDLTHIPAHVVARNFNNDRYELQMPRITIADILAGDPRFSRIAGDVPDLARPKAKRFAEEFYTVKRMMNDEQT